MKQLVKMFLVLLKRKMNLTAKPRVNNYNKTTTTIIIITKAATTTSIATYSNNNNNNNNNNNQNNNDKLSVRIETCF